MGPKFVEFECGCVGFRTEGQKDIVLDRCDTMGGYHWTDKSLRPGERNMAEKSATPADPETFQLLMREIGKLVDDGHRFRAMKELFSE